MFKNALIYRVVPGWFPTAADLEEGLTKHAFQASAPLDMQQLGWIAPRPGSGLAYNVQGQFLLTFRAQKRLLPGSVVNQFTKARIEEIEEKQGYRPGKKQCKEIKERVYDELLPKAFSIHRDTNIWLDLQNRWLVIDSTSSSKADEIIGLLAKCFEPFPIEPIYVAQSSSACMTNWLADDEAPANFTIDMDAELRASGESRACIRWVKHSLDVDDTRRHIQAGKHCTRLALTWSDRISFVLTEAFQLKSIKPLDVLKEGTDAQAQNDDEKFDSDLMLMALELNKLFSDLIHSHGGEKHV